MPAEFSTAPNVIVEALAGTGKTFTIKTGVRSMHYIGLPKGIVLSEEQAAIVEAMKEEGDPGRVHLTSFSTDATEQLKTNLPEGVTASSTHGMGFSAAKRCGIGSGMNLGKYNRICTDFLGGRWEGERKYPGFARNTIQLCEKARLGLKRTVTEEDVKSLADHYGVDIKESTEFTTKALNFMLAEGLKQDQVFDYTDMVWIPVLKNLLRKDYDHLIVDEYQDMGMAQQEICYRVARRVIAIGDANQAIYGFMGADDNATKNFQVALGRTARKLKMLPLVFTRRCCLAVVEMANRIVPQLRAVPGMQEGKVDRSTTGSFDLKSVHYKDMIICPTNAPLVMLLFKLVKAGKKAYVRKSDIVDSMIEYVDSHQKGIAELRQSIQRNLDRLANGKKTLADRYNQDKYECLAEIAQQCPTLDGVTKALSNLFVKDNRPNATRLSSVHRSKGLEAERVIFWNWNLCGKRATQEWERIQAKHLQYVGITRAKSHLTLVEGQG